MCICYHTSGVDMISERGGSKKKTTLLNGEVKLENPPPSQNFLLIVSKIFNDKEQWM